MYIFMAILQPTSNRSIFHDHNKLAAGTMEVTIQQPVVPHTV